MSNRIFIALGSNLGDRRATLDGALAALDRTPGVRVVQASRFVETDPVGGPAGQGAYLNAAAELATELAPHALLAVLLDIENRFGRVRVEHWGPRTLDLDLLLYGDRVIDTPTLVVPHPRMHERAFVLEPLAQIAGEVAHPVLGRRVADLLAKLITAEGGCATGTEVR